MRILSLLPSISLVRLQEATSNEDIVEAASSPAAFFQLVARAEWDTIIVDPEMATHEDCPTFLRRLRRCSQPLIIYTSLSRESASMVAALAAHSLAGIILRDYDDSFDLLHNALARLPMEFFGAQMVERLGVEIDALPIPLRRATTAAYCSALLLRSPTDYARLGGFTRRSVDRWLQKVGLSPAKWIIASAQFLRAYPFLQASVLPLAAVSRMCGYGSLRALKHNSMLLTGYDVVHFRTKGFNSNIIDLVEQAVRSK